MSTEASFKKYPFDQIRSIQLNNYLGDRRWKKESFAQREIKKFRSPTPIDGNNKYVYIFIPNEGSPDYNVAMKNAIEGISAYERRDFDSVLSQILNFGDLLKIVVSNIETKRGSMPLPKGVSMFEAASDLVIYSACAELDSNIKNFRRKLRKAIDFAEKCLIGQSQYGSYIANIHCPIPRPRNQSLIGEPASPFERKVILRILRGLEDISEAIKVDNSNPIVNNYNNGLNSNMCDSLINLIDIGMDSDIKITANLEPVWPIPNEIKTEYILNNYSKYYLEKASEILKGEPSEVERELEGFVLRLERAEDEEVGTIELIVMDKEDPNIFRAKTKLDPDLYQLAIEAHRGKRNIHIRGKLKKLGKRWYIDNPEGLEIKDKSKSREDIEKYFGTSQK